MAGPARSRGARARRGGARRRRPRRAVAPACPAPAGSRPPRRAPAPAWARSRPRAPARALLPAPRAPRPQARRASAGSRWSSPLFVAQRQDGQERLLRPLDPPHLLHPPLARLLLLEQLALAGDVAAVALGDHVLAVGLDRLARDDVRADRGLDRHVVLLARDARPQLLGQSPPDRIGLLAMHDHRQRVD